MNNNSISFTYGEGIEDIFYQLLNDVKVGGAYNNFLNPDFVVFGGINKSDFLKLFGAPHTLNSKRKFYGVFEKDENMEFYLTNEYNSLEFREFINKIADDLFFIEVKGKKYFPMGTTGFNYSQFKRYKMLYNFKGIDTLIVIFNLDKKVILMNWVSILNRKRFHLFNNGRIIAWDVKDFFAFKLEKVMQGE